MILENKPRDGERYIIPRILDSLNQEVREKKCHYLLSLNI